MSCFNWTGNPFVDTGLAVLVAKTGKRSLSEVTEEDFKKVFSDIAWLGNVNRKLKAYSLVIGTNGVLTQPGFGKETLEKSLIKQVLNMAFFEYTGNKFSGMEGCIAAVHYSKKNSLKEITVEDFKNLFDDERWENISSEVLRNYSLEDKLTQYEIAKKKKGKNLPEEVNNKINQHREMEEKLKRSLKETKEENEIQKRRLQAPLDWQLSQYKIFVETLLEDVLTSKYASNQLCEITALPATTALKEVSTRMLNKLELTESEKRKMKGKEYQIGREWFPLAGSLGNDAQALPAGSRSPHISSLAVLMAQLLPLGVLAISRNVNGKMKSYLVCLQFNVPEVNVLIVKSIYDKVIARVDFASEKNKLKTIGTEKGSKSVALFLLDKFRELKDAQEFHKINNLHLNVWMFSNFGTGADCDYFEVPNPSLRFLQAAAQNYFDELKGMLIREIQTKNRYSLLDAIERKADYEPLYPYRGSKDISVDMKRRIGRVLNIEVEEDESKNLLEPEVEGVILSKEERKKKPKKKSYIELLEKTAKSSKRNEKLVQEIQHIITEIEEVQSRPASKGLFSFYQTKVVGVNPNALIMAERIALYLEQNLTGDKSEKLLSEMRKNDFKKIPLIREHMVDMAMSGKLTLDEYTCLFTMESKMPLRVSGKGWKYIWFYLNHENLVDGQTNLNGEENMFTHPKIKSFANDYFHYFMQKQKGSLRKFELYVLEPFDKGQVNSRTMQEWFCDLAKVKDTYTCEEWDDLCKDENGNDAIYEVRFQMRLHFTNLYREYKNKHSQ
ncbi:MAG: hypothetical protein QME52_08475 [Bacteroidota bacterium]|nr:hypothetical protein [Bacteroidota bacterium]